MQFRQVIQTVQAKRKKAFASAVIVAAGSSTRMEGTDKLFAMLDGLPVLARTLLAFEQCESIREIVLVAREEKLIPIAALCKEYGIQKAGKILLGGATRQESALAGVSEVSEEAELIAIHDGARPLVSPTLIEALLAAARTKKAVAPSLPLADTVKEVSGSTVLRTPERASLQAVQTPQCFDAALIKGALTHAVRENLSCTDDCSAVELLGYPVTLLPGERENLKITTPLDLVIAEAILQQRKEQL